ncbi:MAG: metallophosphoesterase [Parachlamydia sp.]|nr:metallophosphoesterase [Parachlamydia sp.]
MTIWAIADLHLAIGVPEKSMEAFGEPWLNYIDKIQTNWKERIFADDLVLLPGDISWAMRPEEARTDLEWIHQLPGTKVMLKGNHDYWWTSMRQIEQVLPPSIHLIQNNAFLWNGVSIGGARLWDTSEYHFSPYIQYNVNPRAKALTEAEDTSPDAEKIFLRELGRLELSLKAMPEASLRIAMTHYPPLSATLEDSRASALLEKYHINICVFGHLHSVKTESTLFGKKNGIEYHLASADYLNFVPLKIAE